MKIFRKNKPPRRKKCILKSGGYGYGSILFCCVYDMFRYFSDMVSMEGVAEFSRCFRDGNRYRLYEKDKERYERISRYKQAEGICR